MNLTLSLNRSPLLYPPALLTDSAGNNLATFQLPTNRRLRVSRSKLILRVHSSSNTNGPNGFSWVNLSRSIRLGTDRFLLKLGDAVKRETGVDLGGINVKVGELVERVKSDIKIGENELTRFRTELWPEFLSWNSWVRWKLIYSCQRIYVVVRAPYLNRERRKLAEAYMEALIPEPSPVNVRKFKKGLWRRTIPKGLKLKKFVEQPDGTVVHDPSYVGEDAWDDDSQPPQENVKPMIDNNVKLDAEEKKELKKDLGIAGAVVVFTEDLKRLYITMKEGFPLEYIGVLLSGPPGTGKTLFARTLAKESGLPFVFASGAEFTDSEKSGAARINEMFSIARRNAPSFVFVDEIDAIAGRHARKDPRRRATFEALIAQLDGEKEKTGVDRFSLRQAVIFICATNRPDDLDLEFVRLGRIDRRLYIGLPDAKQRVQIFCVHSVGKQLAEDVDFGKVRKGHSMIHQKDIVDVLDKQLLEGMGVLLTEEEQQKCEQSVSFEKKRLLAVHEAGHILLAHLFPRFDWHAFSQLLPGGKETAISVFYPREDMIDQGYTTFGYMKMQMVVAHGGHCAEHLVFGNDITDGGSDDLEKITKIAREMVISPQNPRLGLTALIKRIGLIDRPDSPDGQLIKYKWDDPYVIPADMTVEVSELFTRELTRYVEETEELAMKGLRDNMHILDVITRELLEKSRITGLEVEDMMKGLSPTMFEDFVKPFQINLKEDGPLPHNEKLRYQPLDIYPAPLHRC